MSHVDWLVSYTEHCSLAGKQWHVCCVQLVYFTFVGQQKHRLLSAITQLAVAQLAYEGAGLELLGLLASSSSYDWQQMSPWYD